MKLPVCTLIITMNIVACATTPKSNDTSSTIINPASSNDVKLEIIPNRFSSGLTDYKFKNNSYKAEWTTCTAKQGAPFVAYFHGNLKNKAGEEFCSDWPAQVLTKNGFNVVAVNRPSFNNSTGTDDLAGPQSVAASLSGIKAAVNSNPVIGYWGVDSGVIAATFATKTSINLKWLLLGNGFYDMEIMERQTKDDSIRQSIQKQKENEGDTALEKRSISWDSAGLPKTIAIYHAKDDDIAPKNQADAFNDQLRTAQTKVFFEEINGVGHDIPWFAHFQIVEKALTNLK